MDILPIMLPTEHEPSVYPHLLHTRQASIKDKGSLCCLLLIILIAVVVLISYRLSWGCTVSP